MERGRLLKLYENATRARELELDLSELNKEEVSLQKKIEELEQGIKPKKRFFGFVKRDLDNYEMNQAKVNYDIAMRELSSVQDLIRVKSCELSSLQGAKAEFAKMYEEKLAAVKFSGLHKEKLQELEEAYLASSRRKELLPEAKEKAWRLQYQIQNIILILKQAEAAYDADVRSSIPPFNKFERIDKAKVETEKLEEMLKEFQYMLNGMGLELQMQVDTKNFVSYAQEGGESFWTDSRILTLQVRERIRETIKEFKEKEIHIVNFREELAAMEKRALREIYENQSRLEEFVIFLHI